MTTNDISTGNLQELQRSVSELLQLDTYQGMNDAEIQSLIDFYKETSYTEGWQAGNTAGVLDKVSEVKELSAASFEKAEAAFNMAVNSVVKLESV